MQRCSKCLRYRIPKRHAGNHACNSSQVTNISSLKVYRRRNEEEVTTPTGGGGNVFRNLMCLVKKTFSKTKLSPSASLSLARQEKYQALESISSATSNC